MERMNTGGGELRDYQIDIRRRVLEAWGRHRSVMVQMPTGTGKTHLLASLIRDFAGGGGDSRVWIVAHRRELVGQIEDTLGRFGIRTGEGRVAAMSVQRLSRHWDDFREAPSLVVIDEAHHALAETYRELWRRYPGARKLGVTATPCRMDGRGFTDLFGTLVSSGGVAGFILRGWLSPFDYVSVREDSEECRLVDGLTGRGADGDYRVKEMDAVLNRRPSIERLYGSVLRYAEGRKGIVYAVSVAHARNIARYYSERGVGAAAIDGGTPSSERARLVDAFREGKLRVLVNVDVFSEGFDCPDVEFVQMARPTLSLSKYLQQVGRGLRRVPGKDGCVLIDNVGLYRLFGLPVAERDWDAMFEGRLSGKGNPREARAGASRRRASVSAGSGGTGADCGLETVTTRGRLLETLASREGGGPLIPFRDGERGLWGLRRGDTAAVLPRYAAVFDVSAAEGLAAVRFADFSTGVVDGSGEVRLRTGRCSKMRFLADGLLAVTDVAGRPSFVDLRNGKSYARRPEVRRFGKVEMLESCGLWHGRTRVPFVRAAGTGLRSLCAGGSCLTFYDFLSAPRCRTFGVDAPGCDRVCLLAGDYESCYHFCGSLADGGVVVSDDSGGYYLFREGEGKRLVAREPPASPEEGFEAVVPRLAAEAVERAARLAAAERRERERRLRARIEGARHAVPFRSGLRWGLRQGDRVIVPPVYRSIGFPVGDYCAFEGDPCRWGVLMLDGSVVVEARYAGVAIGEDGTARLTTIPGRTRTVKLRGSG